MPSAQHIIDDLAWIARDELPAAIAWHLLAACAFIAGLADWRPSQRAAAWLLSLPLVSVCAAAATHDSRFNAALTGAGTLILLALGSRLRRPALTRGTRAELFAGLAASTLGLVYPHFLGGYQPALYVIAAPVGVLPCPTLLVMTGFALTLAGLHARGWSSALGALSLFYGLFGALRLGVWLDLGLVAAALALLACVWLPHAGAIESPAVLRRRSE